MCSSLLPQSPPPPLPSQRVGVSLDVPSWFFWLKCVNAQPLCRLQLCRVMAHSFKGYAPRIVLAERRRTLCVVQSSRLPAPREVFLSLLRRRLLFLPSRFRV